MDEKENLSEKETTENINLEEKIKLLEKRMFELEKENLDLKKENADLKEKIAKDDLTGLLRRNFFKELTKQQINSLLEPENEKREEGFSTLSFLFLDLDNFKEINDIYGHDRGDKLLKKISDILRENVRDTDYISRWGGDEFVISLLGSNENEAKKKAEFLNEIIHNNVKNEMGIDITLSVGVSEYEEGIGFSELIERADKAMYKSKTEGKNIVSTYSEYQEDIEKLKEQNEK